MLLRCTVNNALKKLRFRCLDLSVGGSVIFRLTWICVVQNED